VDKKQEVAYTASGIRTGEGRIVTTDAMGCRKAIAEQIVAQGVNYVLAVKENQGASRLQQDPVDLP